MIRHSVVALIAVLASLPIIAGAAGPLPQFEVAADVVMVDRYPTGEATFARGVQGLPSLVYWEPAGHRPLTLDLYLPPPSMQRPANGFPFVVYIHGGAWLGGNPRRNGPFVDFPAVLAALAARGYVVAAIEYRPSSEARFPAQIHDVKAAIRWLRLNASQHGLDPMRGMTWGVSAGGHLAALAAVTCGVSEFSPRPPSGARAPGTRPDPIMDATVSDCVQGAVAWYGVFNLATLAEQAKQADAMARNARHAPARQLLGCVGVNECSRQQLAAASPVDHVDAKDPPIMLIVGTEDTTVPYQQTLEMARKLDRAGVEHELIVLPGIRHSLIGRTPEQTRNANLRSLAVTFQYFDQFIGKPAMPRR